MFNKKSSIKLLMTGTLAATMFVIPVFGAVNLQADSSAVSSSSTISAYAKAAKASNSLTASSSVSSSSVSTVSQVFEDLSTDNVSASSVSEKAQESSVDPYTVIASSSAEEIAVVKDEKNTDVDSDLWLATSSSEGVEDSESKEGIDNTDNAKNSESAANTAAENAAENEVRSTVKSDTVRKANESYAESAAASIEKIASQTKLLNGTKTYTFIPCEDTDDIEHSETYKIVQSVCEWDGTKLTRSAGRINGPNGQETYYNLDMSGVLNIMAGLGYTDPYWVRSDGVKMIGNYIMIAADLSNRPKGTIVETSLGLGLVCDTGSLAYTQSDIAVNW